MALSATAYHEYLRSAEWRVVKRLALDNAGGRCELCNSTEALNVHHRTYDRVFREVLSDLTVLCRGCHAKFHDKLPSAPEPEPEPLRVVENVIPFDGDPLPIDPEEHQRQDRIAAECFALPLERAAA